MPLQTQSTAMFVVGDAGVDETRQTLRAVYAILLERGYDPLKQLTGYLVSGDLSFITTYRGARQMLAGCDHEALVLALVKHYLR